MLLLFFLFPPGHHAGDSKSTHSWETTQDHDLVFTTDVGAPVSIYNLTHNYFKPALERARLPRIVRLYGLRHTCATLLLQAGENPKVVSERLGHAGITLTLDVYPRVLPDLQKGAVEKLEALVFGGGVQGVYS